MVVFTNPPMFKCCGGGQSKPDNKGSSVKEAMVDAVQQIASAIVPKAVYTSSPVTTKNCVSPTRLIDGRSKCYESGVLSEDEYLKQY